MSNSPQPTPSDTATLVRHILDQVGNDGPMALSNPITGESCPVPAHVADLIRQVLASLAAGNQVAVTGYTYDPKRRAAMDDLYALEREIGLVDGPPPPKAAFKSDDRRGA